MGRAPSKVNGARQGRCLLLENQSHALEPKSTDDEAKQRLDNWMSQYGRDVMNLAYAYVKSYHQAQDITQDVFLKAYSRMDSFRGDSSVKTWLLTITANRCRDYLRSWSKKHEQLGEDTMIQDRASEDTERMVMEQINRDSLWNAVKDMPVPYREVVILYYQRVLSTREIADVLGITEQTVRTRLHRGRVMLRDSLEKGDWV